VAYDEVKGLLDVIVGYGCSWLLLEGYDEDNLAMSSQYGTHKFVLGYREAKDAIAQLKDDWFIPKIKIWIQKKVNEFWDAIRAYRTQINNKLIGFDNDLKKKVRSK